MILPVRQPAETESSENGYDSSKKCLWFEAHFTSQFTDSNENRVKNLS